MVNPIGQFPRSRYDARTSGQARLNLQAKSPACQNRQAKARFSIFVGRSCPSQRCSILPGPNMWGSVVRGRLGEVDLSLQGTTRVCRTTIYWLKPPLRKNALRVFKVRYLDPPGFKKGSGAQSRKMFGISASFPIDRGVHYPGFSLRSYSRTTTPFQGDRFPEYPSSKEAKFLFRLEVSISMGNVAGH
jgi:hypothetical protein